MSNDWKVVQMLDAWAFDSRIQEIGADRVIKEAATEIEKLRAALKQAKRDALEEAARRLAELHRNHKYNPQTGEGSEHDAGYYRAISEGAAWILALGEKE